MPSRGFTLVEVLVALLLMALMSAMAWRGLDGMLRSRDITQASIERSAVLQTALAQWEQDLAQIQDSGEASTPPLRFDGRHLRLTRRHPQGLQVVTWMLGEGQWRRWTSAPVRDASALRRAWEQGVQPQVLAAQGVPVLEGVSDWQLFYYWESGGWANAQSTGDTATPPPGGGANKLPHGVRLQLQFGAGSGLSGTLTRQVLLATAG